MYVIHRSCIKTRYCQFLCRYIFCDHNRLGWGPVKYLSGDTRRLLQQIISLTECLSAVKPTVWKHQKIIFNNSNKTSKIYLKRQLHNWWPLITCTHTCMHTVFSQLYWTSNTKCLPIQLSTHYTNLMHSNSPLPRCKNFISLSYVTSLIMTILLTAINVAECRWWLINTSYSAVSFLSNNWASCCLTHTHLLQVSSGSQDRMSRSFITTTST